MNIKQRSPEWLELRKTKICSTDAAIILEINPRKKPYDLLLEKLSLVDPDPVNAAMQRGIDLEEKALECFYQMTGIFTMPKCVINDFQMSSLDGMTLDGTKIVEVKCPSKTTHNMAKKGKLPIYYNAQCQHHLSVTGLEMVYYFSFDGEEGVIVEVPRDDKYIKHLVESEKEFFTALMSFVDNKDISKYYNPRPG